MKIEWPKKLLENDDQMEKIRHTHYGSPICRECAYIMLVRFQKLLEYKSLNLNEKNVIIKNHRKGLRRAITKHAKVPDPNG